MIGQWFKGIVLAALFLAILSGCSQESPDSPKFYNKGELTFINSCPYTVVLSRIVQTRRDFTDSDEPDRRIYPGARYRIPNIIDGGYLFDGGDRVHLKYRSLQVDHSGSPLFTHYLEFLVNGMTIIRVKGQGGEYVISSN
jgi:hypothetical protein